MNTFQIVGLVVFPLTVIGIILAMFRGWVSRRECLAWTVVMLAACIAIAWPETTSRAAKAIGIGRGADLVSYCSVVAMLIGFWMVYLRLRKVQRDLTLVVRRLALLEAPFPPHDASSCHQPQAPEDHQPQTPESHQTPSPDDRQPPSPDSRQPHAPNASGQDAPGLA